MTIGVQAEARAQVFGTEFYVGDLAAATEAIVTRAASGLGGYATFTGTHGLTSAPYDAAWREALTGAWCNFPDGAPVAWRLRRLGLENAERIPGPDTFPMVVDRGRDRGIRHFLLGSTDRVLETLESRLRGLAPAAEIVGSYSPPFRPLTVGDDAEIVAAIVAASPHILWVGLGAPKQDIWMARHAADLQGVLCIGVGAAFDFLAGNKRRAPLWMQRAGLEWFHRFVREPRKLGPRYALSISRFATLSAAQAARSAWDGRRRIA